jgi:hypothetical protein
VVGRDIFYFVNNHSDSTKKFSETEITNMLEVLIDNIFVMFGGPVFQQTVGMHTWVQNVLFFNRPSLSISRCRSRYEADPICICGILYFKLNGINAINELAKPRII